MSETGLKDDSEERTEPDWLRLKMLAESTESRWATGVTVLTVLTVAIEEVLDLWTVGVRGPTFGHL